VDHYRALGRAVAETLIAEPDRKGARVRIVVLGDI